MKPRSSGAHHWAREFAQFGHTVRLMAPKFVAPYRLSGKRGKNDAADAQAICDAVTRPNMRFVPIKTIDQQGQLMVRRARQSFVEQRTAPSTASVACWMPSGHAGTLHWCWPTTPDLFDALEPRPYASPSTGFRIWRQSADHRPRDCQAVTIQPSSGSHGGKPYCG
jgi:hypothetical protein